MDNEARNAAAVDSSVEEKEEEVEEEEQTADNSAIATSSSISSAKQAITHIVYTKTSCYFCNEWLENDNFKDHIGQCSQTLIECPNACASYIQRRLLDDHLRTCPRAVAAAPSPQSSIDDEYARPIALRSSPANNAIATDAVAKREQLDNVEERLLLLEDDIDFVREALNEEARQRHKLIGDVSALRRRNAVEDEWTLKVGEVLASFKKLLGDESDSRCIDVTQLKVDIARLELQYQEVNEWRSEMQMQLDQLERDAIPDGSVRNYIDVLMQDNRISALKIYELESAVKLLRQRSEDAHRISSTNDVLLLEKLGEIDEFLAANQKQRKAENGNESGVVSLQPSLALPDLVDKVATLDFEVKSLKHICTDAEDKCDKLEQIVVEARQTAAKTKQLLADLEEHLRLQRTLAAIENVDGHLIWRIVDYAAKMKQAKENEVTLQSPLFCNQKYGYTLRLDVHLNGIGHWRGRNVLACLTVVPGEWDALLPWPCKLQADILLRDQPDDLAKASDMSKTIVAKSKMDACEQGQFIFIPHKTIKKQNFVRNDAIYFEVRVHAISQTISPVSFASSPKLN